VAAIRDSGGMGYIRKATLLASKDRVMSLVVAQQSCAANSNLQQCRLTMHVKQILSAALDRWLRQPSEEVPWSPLHLNPQLRTV
jgi:hypothetical protein